MDTTYLIDTDILIYYFSDIIPEKELNRIENIFKTSFNLSIITKIEFLGWKKHTEKGFEKAIKFVSFANIITLTNEISNLTIDIRRETNIKLPDAVVDATALHNDAILITRNEKDFKDVKELKIYNPFN